jgi:hypothetical protein
MISKHEVLDTENWQTQYGIEGGEIYTKKFMYRDNHFPSSLMILKYPYMMWHKLITSDKQLQYQSYSAKILNLDIGEVEEMPDRTLYIYYQDEHGRAIEDRERIEEREEGGSTTPEGGGSLISSCIANIVLQNNSHTNPNTWTIQDTQALEEEEGGKHPAKPAI